MHTKAYKIREKLRKELKGKLLALKVDAATRHNRSILGINVQFVANGKIQIRTLAMIELTESHTAENLLDTILDVLRSYGLTIYNIYSLTTDNAKNVVKISKLIGEVQCDAPVENLLALDSEESSTEEEFEPEERSEEQVKKDLEHSERLIQLLDNLVTELKSVAPEVELDRRCESIRLDSILNCKKAF